MPYVKREVRVSLYPELGPLYNRIWDEQLITGSMEGAPGTLNYIITLLVQAWLGDDPNYERYNAAIGVLECAKMELYRRQVAPYDDGKRKENGDVYTT